MPLRVALGLTLLWFGAAELWSPGDWVVYVPQALDRLDPGLMWVHALLLVLVGLALVLGTALRPATVVGTLILGGVLAALAAKGEFDGIFVRDVGLLGAMIGLTMASGPQGEVKSARLPVGWVLAIGLVFSLLLWWHGYHQPTPVQLGGVGSGLQSIGE